MSAKRIALYGNFGSGNLGNECTLQVVSERIRQRWPDAELLCICTVPRDVRARHGMAAVQAALDPRPAQGALWRQSRALRLLFRRLPQEVMHWLKSFRILLRSDMLVVPGTGIVSDHLCGPGSWPYDIFKWSTLAALCRVELVFLSIGVGPLRHPLSRWFVRQSLLRARYRSYRDATSKRYVEELGVRTAHDGVYPDLVFGLSERHLGIRGARSLGRRIVGVGLKDYSGVSGGAAAAGAYRRYLEAMADFVGWLQERGFGVRLLIGDLQYDGRAWDDLLDLLRRRALATEPPLLMAEKPTSVADLVRELRETEMVISPRFHNLVLALMLGKPVIALSDHPKLDALAMGLGLARYRVCLADCDLATLNDCFGALERDSERLKLHIRAQVERNREALEEQYLRLFSAGSDAHDVHTDEPRGRVRDQPRAASR